MKIEMKDYSRQAEPVYLFKKEAIKLGKEIEIIKKFEKAKKENSKVTILFPENTSLLISSYYEGLFGNVIVEIFNCDKEKFFSIANFEGPKWLIELIEGKFTDEIILNNSNN